MERKKMAPFKSRHSNGATIRTDVFLHDRGFCSI